MNVVKDSVSDPLLNKKAVSELLGIQPRTLERYLATGRFPQPLRIGGSTHCLRWRRSTVESYLDKLARESER